MNYYFITLAIIVTVLVIWLFYRYIKTGIMLKKENESIKVGRDLRGRKVMLFCSFVWIFIAAGNVYFDSDKISEIKAGLKDSYHRSSLVSTEEHRDKLMKEVKEHRKLYVLIGIVWLFDGAICVLEMTKYRNAHLTAKGVYLPDSFLPAESLECKISGDDLDIFHNKFPRHIKCRIIEDREEIEKLLAENYGSIN